MEIKRKPKEFAQEIRQESFAASRARLHGADYRFFEGISDHYRKAVVTPDIFQATCDLAKNAAHRSTSIYGYFGSRIHVENGVLTDESYVEGATVELSPDDAHKDDFSLVLRHISMRNGFFKMLARPFPVRIRLNHIFDRYGERSAKDIVNIMEDFHHSMPFAVLLSELMEKKMLRDKKTCEPFALPTPDGFLFGQANKVPEEKYYNLRGMFVQKSGTPKLALYSRMPNVELQAFTYVSIKEMFPEQKRLHEIMKPFVSWDENPAMWEIGRSYVDYIGTIKDDPSIDPPSDFYLQLRDNISKLLDSKLWKSAVRLPTSMQPFSASRHFR